MRPYEVVVVGESLIDTIVLPDGAVQSVPGGSAANTALALGRLGRVVGFGTSLGADAHGAAIRAWLAASGVDVFASPAEATSVARATLAADGSASYEFDLRWDVDLSGLPESHVVHAGSLGAVLNPGAVAVESFVAAARTRSTISIDPNIRQHLCTEDSRRQLARVFAHADVIKLSDEDHERLSPTESFDTTARRWLAGGAALVVLTQGPGDITAYCRSGVVRCQAATVPVVDTVGAGDTFGAALLDGLLAANLAGAPRKPNLREITQETLEQILRRAARAAAITVSRRGANPPSAHELDADVGT